jgi:hypothetical protein
VKDSVRNMAHSLAQLPGGRRTKFAFIAVWLVALFALGPLAGKFEDAQENDPADYLPAKAESVKTLDRLHGFRSDGEADAITVFHRDGALTAADRAAIERVRTAINDRIRPAMNAVRRDTVAATGPARFSPDGRSALLTTPIAVPAQARGDAEGLVTDTPAEIKGRLGLLERYREVVAPATRDASRLDELPGRPLSLKRRLPRMPKPSPELPTEGRDE